MNQGIAFARTLRALNADDFRTSKLGILAAAALLAAWTWWMLTASIPQYESTTNVRIETGRAVAYFSPDAVIRIQPGQHALVHLDGIALPARVQSATADQTELIFTSQQPPAAASTSATAEIETTRVSPAAIALRTLGRGSR
jgi:hypothetical protein